MRLARLAFPLLLLAPAGPLRGGEPEAEARALAAGAWEAWSRSRDDEALRLADAALALDPDEEAARMLRGERRREGTWVAGWRPPGGRLRWARPPLRGEARRRALEAAGFGGAAEAALGRALDWLAAHQDPDGRIDADGFERHCPEGSPCGGRGGGHHGEAVPSAFDGTATALAVMAWLSGGGTLEEGPHAEALRRGRAFLLPLVDRPARGFDAIWELAHATQALAELAAAVRDRGAFEAAARGVVRLEALQGPDGGWRYFPSAVGDVPTTSAVGLALGQAARAGVAVDREVVRRLIAFLDARVVAASGRSEYHEGAERLGYTPTWANSASALAARALLGVQAGAPVLARQLGALTERSPSWRIAFREVKTPDGRRVRAQVGTLYPYAWYHASQALAAHGGGAWTSWARAVRAALLAGQRKEGHAEGSWDPLGTYSDSGGRAVVTAWLALVLAAPLRSGP